MCKKFSKIFLKQSATPHNGQELWVKLSSPQRSVSAVQTWLQSNAGLHSVWRWFCLQCPFELKDLFRWSTLSGSLHFVPNHDPSRPLTSFLTCWVTLHDQKKIHLQEDLPNIYWWGPPKSDVQTSVCFLCKGCAWDFEFKHRRRCLLSASLQRVDRYTRHS